MIVSELNAFLQPKDSPITNRPFVDGIQFDAVNERNAVGKSKIKDFTFSSGRGGTIVLGGTANGNGQLLIKDASGATIVEGNNDGITVYNGNIVVKNGSNTTILDTSGLVSTANFPSDQVINSTGYTTTSTSLTDITGSTLDTFTLDRQARVLVIVQTQGRNDNFVVDGSSAEFNVNDSLEGNLITYDMFTDWRLTAINEDGSGFVTSWDMDTFYEFQVVAAIFDFAAGSHTLKLRFRVDGTGTARVGTYLLTYIILGS